jgi:hypothetical protein
MWFGNVLLRPFPRFHHCFTAWYRDRAYYKKLIADYPNGKQLAIFMCDGKVNHAGLTDRLYSILSVFKLCKENNIDFAIHWVHPFALQDFLQPNSYNWIIDNQKITYDKRISEPIVNFPYHTKSTLLQKIKRTHKKQLHIYTSALFITDFSQFVSQLFNELFKPTDKLQQQIDFHYAKIGGNYLGLTFRFQHQLGDFNEYNLKSTLSESEKTELIQKCIEQIYRFHEEYPQHPVVFVTSDSVTFLNEAKKIEFVYIVEGNRIHVDCSAETDEHTVTFLDMFLLSKAQAVFTCGTENMYVISGFGRFAAAINNVPFEVREF